MVKVTKLLYMPKNTLVFDYESLGDLFYMVISGKVHCKVPFNKQLIMLNPEELALFKLTNKDDILSIQEATEINKILDQDGS